MTPVLCAAVLGAVATAAIFTLALLVRAAFKESIVCACVFPGCYRAERGRGLCDVHLADFLTSPEYLALETDPAGLHRNPTAVDLAWDAWATRIARERRGAA